MLMGGVAASSAAAIAAAPDVEQFLPMATGGRGSPAIVAAPASASAAAGGTAQEGLEPLVARADVGRVCSSHEEL